jgi:hypothetical protein
MALSKNYLQLEFGSGLFFEYSKEPKEGYEQHTSKNNNVSYRKYYRKGVTGVLDSVTIYEGKFGQQISISLKSGDDIYYVPIDIYDQKGQVDTYAESVIKFLPNLNKGMEITIFPYNFTPENETYSKVGVSFTYEGVKMKPALTNSYINREGVKVEGDIPALVWVEKLGKRKPSAASIEAKDDFLLNTLTEQTNRLTWKNDTPSVVQEDAPKQLPTPTATEAFETSVSDDDDLPF